MTSDLAQLALILYYSTLGILAVYGGQYGLDHAFLAFGSAGCIDVADVT